MHNKRMEWRILELEDAQNLLDIVADEALPGLFLPDFVRFQEFFIDFYANARLLLLENLKVAPPFAMEYLQSGETIVYLDGSPEPFRILNQAGCLRLNENNVVDYIRTYCAFVNQRPHNILLLQSPEFLPFQDTIYIDFHFDKNNYTDADIKVRRNPENNGYIIDAPFIFSGKIDMSIALVSDSGDVHIERAVAR